MQVGDPIGEGWDIYKRFWRHLLPIAFVVIVIIGLVTLILHGAGAVGAIGAFIVAIVGLYLVQAALVQAVADVRDGRADLSLTMTLASVVDQLGSILVASILGGIAIGIGLLLLLAPGLYLLTIWSVIIPVIVLEGVGALDSFGRSRELVRGYGWTVFGVILITVLINFAVHIVLAIVLSGLNDSISSYLTTVIADTLVTPFAAAVLTAMYFRLKALHAPPEVASGAAYSDA
ncbi:MAG TPA: hypothetical protein VGQ38_05690 [Gaiellaceae bacterium]|nr:hypothetical protein [Gaiellaceae bacterium]